MRSIFSYTFNSKYAKESDKAYFVFSVLLLLSTVYIFAISPDKYFYHWIAITQTGLFLKRMVSFWLYDYQFYVVDYCYFANFVQAIFVWVYPGSRYWYLLMCGVAGVGHVAYILKNKLMFHDLDKLAGATLHL